MNISQTINTPSSHHLKHGLASNHLPSNAGAPPALFSSPAPAPAPAPQDSDVLFARIKGLRKETYTTVAKAEKEENELKALRTQLHAQSQLQNEVTILKDRLAEAEKRNQRDKRRYEDLLQHQSQESARRIKAMEEAHSKELDDLAQEQREEAESRVAAVKSQLPSIEEMKNKLKEKHQKLKAAMQQKFEDEIRQKKAQLEAQMEKERDENVRVVVDRLARDEVCYKTEADQQWQSKLDKLSNDYLSQHDELKTKMREKVSEAKRTNEEWSRKCALLGDAKALLEEQLARVRGDLICLQQESSQKELFHQKTAERQTAEIDELTRLLQQARVDLSREQRKVVVLQQTVDETGGQLRLALDEVASLRAEKDALSNRTKAKEEKIQQVYEKIKVAISTKDNTITHLKKELSSAGVRARQTEDFLRNLT